MSGRKSSLNPNSAKYRELKEAFDFFDKNNSGVIEAKEINALLGNLGKGSSQTEVADLMSSIDKDQDNAVSFDEFCVMVKATSRHEINQTEQEQLREQFRVFDLNGDGIISPSELKKVMSMMGEKITDADIDGLLNKYDQNKNGVIEYNEFVKYMLDEEE